MSSIDSRRLDQSFRLLEARAPPRAWLFFIHMCTDGPADKQTDWLGMVPARHGWLALFTFSLLSILGAGVRDGVGKDIWSKACVQEHR